MRPFLMKPDLLDQLAAPMSAKLDQVRAGEAVAFEHVTPAARPFLAAVLARRIKRRAWIVCANVREQELLHNELLNWFPDAFFFPEADVAPVEGAIPDPENAAERLAIVHKLRTAKGRQLLVLTRSSLEETVPAPDVLGRLELTLKRGAKLDRDHLLKQLGNAGYEHVPQVALRGQYAVRGGIIDVFSFHHALPVRIDLFDDEIESIRHFDLDAQTSVQQADTCTLLLGEMESADPALPKRARSAVATCPFRDYIREDDLTIDAGGTWLAAQVRFLEGAELHALGSDFDAEDAGSAEKYGEKPEISKDSPSAPLSIPSASSALNPAGEDFSTAFYDHGLGEFEAGDFIVDEIKRERFFAQLTEWRTHGWSVHVFCNNEGETERLRELVPPVEADVLRFTVGTLARGFTFPAAKVAVLSDAELFGRYRNTRARRLAMRRAREVQSRAQIDFSELTDGELVVHLEHGIGRYEGMRTIPRGDDTSEEVLVVEFANDARLYIPLEQSYLLARYVGVGKRNPPLSVLGDGKWARAKKSAEKAVMDYAGRLLRLHAERELARGHAFPPDNKWQGEFESSFLYKETPDQLTAIAATKADMESEQPMDRLICGDVGFGKTEVAIRAAFKAVMGGKQVAILVPTTVLAQQHYQNFRERMSDYPVTVDLLSRYRTPGEQRKTVQGVRDGTVDIVVGTHRLISKDIEFKNLGLVVIDEEQRFGVLHKEKFKEMFNLVDMLTLSATPIPRTLYLSLMGAKDMSTIETPPPNRIPVETFICPYDERVIRDAINRELARQGQVFFLHNRVQSIGKVRERIQKLCPEARVVIGHGQMDEHELEEVMHQFVSGAADVLVSTTIIESGLDIPNANTIIIDRADRFGLADLYQLRGRVGRAQHKAYAYLMLPRDLMTVGEARKRINAIKQYSSLGAGFKIAMRDLEIRGAGNILGTAQSGHIITIGFELYCALLRQAIAQIKGERIRPRLEVVLKLDFVALREADFSSPPSTLDPRPSTSALQPSVSPPALAPAFLPSSYIAESAPRIQAYRRLSEVTTQEEFDALRKIWRDRFGRMPVAAENLLRLTEIKISAMARKITVVEVREDKLMLTRANDFILLGGKFPRLTATDPTARLREILAMIRSL
jgi:transcription-repair coupling factor (superfamily II helicase)